MMKGCFVDLHLDPESFNGLSDEDIQERFLAPALRCLRNMAGQSEGQEILLRLSVRELHIEDLQS